MNDSISYDNRVLSEYHILLSLFQCHLLAHRALPHDAEKHASIVVSVLSQFQREHPIKLPGDIMNLRSMLEFSMLVILRPRDDFSHLMHSFHSNGFP
jgi:hypothetical protein